MPKKNNSGKTWVLLSGGIDSTACIAFYQEQGISVNGIYIDYGQLSANKESEAATSVAEHYHITLDKLSWSGLKIKDVGLINGRNAFLLLATLMELPLDAGILAIGIHSGTSYPDCNATFINRIQSIFDIYANGVIQIGAPFIKWTKNNIWTFCNEHDIPTHLTYSCELGVKQPCGKCLSCRDLKALYACT